MATNHRDRLFIFDTLFKKLTEEQQFRHMRSEFVNGRWLWNTHEILAMLGAVNDLRMKLGKSLITLEQIEAAESAASGSTDYTKEFVYDCLDLVMMD